MVEFIEELKQLQHQKFIISKFIRLAIYQGTFFEDLTRRAETGGFSVNTLYSLRTVIGTNSTIIPTDISKVWNIYLKTA